MSTYPKINDREYDLIKKILQNTAEIVDNGGGQPGGTDGQVQVNNAGEFAGLDSTGTGNVVKNIYPTLAGYLLTKGYTVQFTAMPALEVDVTIPGNSYVATGDVAFTYSAATHTAFTPFWLRIDADATARTITLPYNHWSMNRNSNITTITVPANGTLQVAIWYTGARWEIFNDPVSTTGTGDFVKSTSPLIWGSWQLSENASVVLDIGVSDARYNGITEHGLAGATLAFGDLCYYAAADSRWELADADAASTMGTVRLGICVLAADADGDPTTMLRYGVVRADAAFPAFTTGSPVYGAVAAGDVMQTTDFSEFTTDDCVRRLGVANDANELFFNPSEDYVTIV